MSAPQTIFCEKCLAVRSYPFTMPGEPYVPVEFLIKGLCDSCRPWKHEAIIPLNKETHNDPQN